MMHGEKGKQSGFTLIEMVVVIAMIGIVTGATLKLVRFSDVYKNLTLKTAEVKGMLRNAQILSLAPPTIEVGGADRLICGFGLRTDGANNEISVFYSYSLHNDVDDCDSIENISDVCSSVTGNGCENYEVRRFDDFDVSDENGQEVKVFFRVPYGSVVGVGDDGYKIMVRQIDSGYTKFVELNKFGKINEE